MEGCDFGWKIPSKTIIKRNEQGRTTATPICNNTNNTFSLFEEAEKVIYARETLSLKKGKIPQIMHAF